MDSWFHCHTIVEPYGAIHIHPQFPSLSTELQSYPLWVHRGRSGLLTLPEAACQELSQLAWSQNLCHICHWIHWTPHLVRLRRWIWRSWLGHPCCWELRSDQLQQWSSAESMNDMNITEPFNKSTFQHVIGMWILWMWQEKVRENQLQFAQVGTTAPTAAVAALTMARPLRCRLGMWGVCVCITQLQRHMDRIFLQVPKFRRQKICLSWGYICCSVYTYEGSVYCTKCKFSCRV